MFNYAAAEFVKVVFPCCAECSVSFIFVLGLWLLCRGGLWTKNKALRYNNELLGSNKEQHHSLFQAGS